MAMFHIWLAELLFYKKEFPAAEQAARKALAIDPNDVSALGQLFVALMEQKKKNDAREVMARLVALQPPDARLQHASASLRGATIENAPKEFVTTLFDGYSDNFDHHLQQVLSYKMPSLIADKIRSLPAMQGRSSLSLLDLGCGTGLVAEALRDITSLRVGIDLSEKMLEQAHAKQLYTELNKSDIVDFMLTCNRTFDLVVATDVLIYVGNLRPLFKTARTVLSPGGLLAFSIEKNEGPDAFHLNQAERYSHNIPYILSLLHKEGYEILIQEESVLRTENDQPVKGVLFVVHTRIAIPLSSSAIH